MASASDFNSSSSFSSASSYVDNLIDQDLAHYVHVTEHKNNTELKNELVLKMFSCWVEANQGFLSSSNTTKLSEIKRNLLSNFGLNNEDRLIQKINIVCTRIFILTLEENSSSARFGQSKQVFVILENLKPETQQPIVELLRGALSGYHSIDRVRLLVDLYLSLPKAYLELFLDIEQQLSDPETRWDFIQQCNQIHVQRIDFIMSVHGLFQNKSLKEADKKEVLSALRPFNRESKTQFLKSIFPLISNSPFPLIEGVKLDSLHDFLASMSAVAEKVFSNSAELNWLLANIVQLVEGVPELSERSKLFFAMLSIPKNDRAGVLEHAYAFISNETEVITRQNVIKTLGQLVWEERQEVLEILRSLPQKLSQINQVDGLLHSFKQIFVNERRPLFELALPLLSQMENGMQMGSILIKFFYLRSEFRQEVVSGCTSVWTELTAHRRLAVVSAAEIFCPDYIEKYFQIVKKFSQELPSSYQELTQFVFLKDESLKDCVYNMHYENLQSETDPEKVEMLSESIMDWQEALLVFEEDSLIQLVLNRMMSTNQETKATNPYRVYKSLQTHLKRDVCTFEIPPQVIAGSLVTFNITHFQQKGHSKKILFEQLPNIAPKKIMSYFEVIEARLQSLDSGTRTLAESHIENFTSLSFSQLKNNFVRDPFLNALVHFNGEKGSGVSSDLARLYAILNFIEDQPNDFSSTQSFLTKREEILLSMSNSIQECKTGKSEGIALAYNLLPLKYKYINDSDIAKKTEAERALNYLDDVVQNAIENMLTCENELMRTATQVEEVKNLSHQSLYLKNQLSPWIGLKHHLKFDAHANVLYECLVTRSFEENLSLFYKYFTPESLISTLQIAFNRDKNEVKTLYSDLNVLLDPKMDFAKVWYLDEDSQPILRPLGAIEIWKAAGYFSVTGKQPVIFDLKSNK